MKKSIVLYVVLILMLLTGCSKNNLKSAELTNTTPAIITVNESSYLLTDEILENNKIHKQIGKIDTVYAVVSYLEEDNPYKNLGRIFQIENIKSEEEIAVQINDKFYIAKIKE